MSITSKNGKSSGKLLHLVQEPGVKWVLSIDIGIIHLGLCLAKVDSDYNCVNIETIKLINITKFKHRPSNISNEECHKHCGMYHNACIADWVEHTCTYYSYLFNKANYILLELQPPCGLKAIEQLLFFKYRNRCILVHPASVHKTLHIGHLDYDQRKVKSIHYAILFIKKLVTNPTNTSSILDKLSRYHRKHDVADAVCMLIHWLPIKRKEVFREREMERLKHITPLFVTSGKSLDSFMEQYRYKP